MEKRNENTISASKNAREQGADTQKPWEMEDGLRAGLGKGGKSAALFFRGVFLPSIPSHLRRELDDVAVAEVVGGLGAEPGRALHHRIARVHELLGGDKARAVVAADLLEVPLLEPDDEVVVLSGSQSSKGEYAARRTGRRTDPSRRQAPCRPCPRRDDPDGSSR